MTYYFFRQWLEGRLVKRRRLIRDQLVAATRLAAQVRAGLPLTEVSHRISSDMPEPLGGLMRRAVNQSEQGRPLKAILLEMKERLRIESFSLLVLTLLIAEERGGRLADVLERIGHSLQEQQRVERKARATLPPDDCSSTFWRPSRRCFWACSICWIPRERA